MRWQPMKAAPKDRPILGLCKHDTDRYFVEGRLTTYAAHAEGMNHVPDGPHVIEWGGVNTQSMKARPGQGSPFLTGGFALGHILKK